MTATVTDADRAAAHALMYSEDLCDWMPLGPHAHSSPCVRATQAIADAREAENRECEAVVRNDHARFGEREGAAIQIAHAIAARRSR